MLSEADRDPDLAGFRQRFTETYMTPIASVVRDAVERDELPADTDVGEATAQLLGPLIFQRFAAREEAVDEGFVERMVALFIRSRWPRQSAVRPTGT